MLLRASRSAECLTKEAGLLGTVGRFAGGLARGLVKSPGVAGGVSGLAGKAAGRALRATWKPLAVVGLSGAAAAPMIAQGMQKARVGLDPRYIQAQKYGRVPQMRAGG